MASGILDLDGSHREHTSASGFLNASGAFPGSLPPCPGSVLIKENNNNNTQVVAWWAGASTQSRVCELIEVVGCLVLAEDLQRDAFDVATSGRLNGGVLRTVLL